MKYLSLSIPGYNQIPVPTGIKRLSELNNPEQKVIQTALEFLLIAGIIVALFFIIYAGIQWTMSGGDKQKLQTARNRLVFSIIGLVVILLSLFIVNLIGG